MANLQLRQEQDGPQGCIFRQRVVRLKGDVVERIDAFPRDGGLPEHFSR